MSYRSAFAPRSSLKDEITRLILETLDDTAINSCAEWAPKYINLDGDFAGPFGYKHYPWLREMMDPGTPVAVGMKGTQLGYTTLGIAKSSYTAVHRRRSVLYLMPADKPHAKDFSMTRFDPILEISPKLRNAFSDTKNVGVKRSGTTSIFIRGSRSKAGVKSLSVSDLYLDEYDEMTTENIPQALKRLSGQLEQFVFYISTPTIPGRLIHAEYLKTTQEFFSFKCPLCSRWTQLLPECVKVTAERVTDRSINDSHYVCLECKGRLPNESKADWLASAKWVKRAEAENRGFWLPGMYSPTLTPKHVAVDIIEARSNIAREQELWNSTFGLPHETKGARLLDTDITTCTQNYTKATYAKRGNTLITVGIDVGRHFHCMFVEWKYERDAATFVNQFDGRVVLDLKVEDIAEVMRYVRQYQVSCAVIDANPERRLARNFVRELPEIAYMCFYNSVEKEMVEAFDHHCKADRTASLDQMYSRFKTKTIALPTDLSEEARSQLKAPVRVPRTNKRTGEPSAMYVEDGADHFAHALNYAEIALAVLGDKAVNGSNINRSPL